MTLITLASRSPERLLRDLLSAAHDAVPLLDTIAAAGIAAPALTGRCRAAFESGDLFDASARAALRDLVEAVADVLDAESRSGFDVYESGIDGEPDEIVPTTELSELGRSLQPIEAVLRDIERRLIACDIALQAQRTLRTRMR